MKNTITLFLASVIISQSNAQQVIGSAGKNLSASGASINFTLGEAFVKEYNTGSINLSTGFHQNLQQPPPPPCNYTWTQKADFGGTAREGAVSFSIGTKGYIGTGYNGPHYQDFWEWDQASNVWTQKADFGGTARRYAVGFSIGTKGYIGTGNDGSALKRDFWEWNQNTNIWVQKANFGGTARNQAVGFSIGTKGYIGTGSDPDSLRTDFWEWDQATDVWTKKANFGGTARYSAVGFSVVNKGYIGTGGTGASTFYQDFWEWDQATDVWTKKANFGGTARRVAACFSIGNKGHIGTGYDLSAKQDFWEWDQATNVWTQKANFGGTAIYGGVGFSIGGKGYIGTGNTDDLWEYSLSCNLTLSITTTNSSCGQATGTATVVATGGCSPYAFQWTNGDNTSGADSLSSGLYQVVVTDANGCTNSAVASINDAGAPVITVDSVTHVSCKGGSNGAINISVTGGAQPYTYYWVNGATATSISNLSAAPYEIEVTDAGGCKSSKSILVTEPAEVSLIVNTTNASCGNADGSATVTASGGTGAFTYLWSNAASASTATGLSAGNYSVTVTDNKGCAKNTQTSVSVNNTGGAVVTLDSITAAGCGGAAGSVYVSVTGGNPPYTYVWSNGSTAQDIVGVAPGIYDLVVQGSNSCAGAFSAAVPSQPPFSPVICLVTVDTLTGTNQCVFEKDSIANLGISKYNIYRETSASGVYQLIGSKPATQLSQWTDPSANPLQRAWRYKISAVDTCGNESPVSSFHKTIHLSANLGLSSNVNLIWDNYEGFTYSTYVIYRYTPATGWDSLDAVAGSPVITYNSYTDFPPTFTNLAYFIAVEHPSADGCTPTLKHKDPEPMATTVNNTKSNTFKIGNTISVSEISLDNSVNIFPNPFAETATLRITNGNELRITVKLFDVLGQEHKMEFIRNSAGFVIRRGNLVAGIYFLKVIAERGAGNYREVVKKIIVAD